MQYKNFFDFMMMILWGQNNVKDMENNLRDTVKLVNWFTKKTLSQILGNCAFKIGQSNTIKNFLTDDLLGAK